MRVGEIHAPEAGTVVEVTPTVDRTDGNSAARSGSRVEPVEIEEIAPEFTRTPLAAAVYG